MGGLGLVKALPIIIQETPPPGKKYLFRGRGGCVIVHTGRSEDSLQESVLSFHMWVLGLNSGPQAW